MRMRRNYVGVLQLEYTRNNEFVKRRRWGAFAAAADARMRAELHYRPRGHPQRQSDGRGRESKACGDQYPFNTTPISVALEFPVFVTCACAVLLCLVCLFDLACFFLSSFSSLI